MALLVSSPTITVARTSPTTAEPLRPIAADLATARARQWVPVQTPRPGGPAHTLRSFADDLEVARGEQYQQLWGSRCFEPERPPEVLCRDWRGLLARWTAGRARDDAATSMANEQAGLATATLRPLRRLDEAEPEESDAVPVPRAPTEAIWHDVGMGKWKKKPSANKMEEEQRGGFKDGFPRPIRRRDRLVRNKDNQLVHKKPPRAKRRGLLTLHELGVEDLRVPAAGHLEQWPTIEAKSDAEIVRRDIILAKAWLRHYQRRPSSNGTGTYLRVVSVFTIIDALARTEQRDPATETVILPALTRAQCRSPQVWDKRRHDYSPELRERVRRFVESVIEPRRVLTVEGAHWYPSSVHWHRPGEAERGTGSEKTWPFPGRSTFCAGGMGGWAPDVRELPIYEGNQFEEEARSAVADFLKVHRRRIYELCPRC
jgi:hypothetical protein